MPDVHLDNQAFCLIYADNDASTAINSTVTNTEAIIRRTLYKILISAASFPRFDSIRFAAI